MAKLPETFSLDPRTNELSLDPHDPDFVQDPYAVYSQLHDMAPRVYWREYGMWCFAGYDDVNRLFRDKRLGRRVPIEKKSGEDRSHLTHFDRVEAGSLLELEPPDHTRLRALVNRAFVSRQIEALRPEIDTLCQRLIDGLPKNEPFDLLPAFATPIPLTIITRMIGIPAKAAPQLLDWSHSMVAMYMHGRDRDVEKRADIAANDFAELIRRQVASYRTGRGSNDSLLGTLVTAADETGKLSEDELVSSMILLLNAGHEATVHQIGNAVRTLLKMGGRPADYFATAERTEAAVEELLRIDPPLHMFTRHAYDDVALDDGFVIEAGSEIALLLGAANRDALAYPEPDIFKPDRPRKLHVSFGAGIHFCIGAPLARLELQIALKILFDRLPELRIAEEPVFRDSYHFHGLQSLKCTY